MRYDSVVSDLTPQVRPVMTAFTTIRMTSLIAYAATLTTLSVVACRSRLVT